MVRKLLKYLLVNLLLLALMGSSMAVPSASAQDGTIPGSSAGPTSYLPIAFNVCPVIKTRLPATVFGVQMYVDTSSEVPYFDPLMELNASWVRTPVPWANVEPSNLEPEEFRWRAADRSLAVAVEGGLNVIATIASNPEWASPNYDGLIPEESLDDFAQFLNALVERYDGDGIDDDPCGRVVKYWELFNEPDGGSKPGDVRWGEYGAEYAEMLKVAYTAIKGADESANVVFGGIAYDWFDDQDPPGPFVRNFLPDVLANGGGAYFDYMNFHVYPAFAPNWTSSAADGPGLYEKAAALRSLMASYGVDKPMVITEAGAHSNADGTSPATQETQASYVVALYTQSLAADIKTMIWFMLYDPPEWYPNKNGLMDLSDPPVLKLAYYTYQRTAEKLGNARFDRILTDGEMGNEAMLAYRFVDPATGHPLYVAWMSPVRTGQSATLALPGRTAQVLDIRGNNTEVGDGGDGQLEIRVTNQPVIIEVTEQ
jgi:hypothetical protein